jgi:hypothetical protein
MKRLLYLMAAALVMLLNTALPARAQQGLISAYGAVVGPNAILTAQQYASSPDGKTILLMQYDGNLVLLDVIYHQVLWNSGTYGNPGAYAYMQSDGNLVIYNVNNVPLWHTATGGHPGAYLLVQNDDNLVVYTGGNPSLGNGTPLWHRPNHTGPVFQCDPPLEQKNCPGFFAY